MFDPCSSKCSWKMRAGAERSAREQSSDAPVVDGRFHRDLDDEAHPNQFDRRELFRSFVGVSEF